MKGPEAIHVPGSFEVSAMQVVEKYLNRQGCLIVDCGCITCTWKSLNLDESVVSTKSENVSVPIVVLCEKQNREKGVQFFRRANYPASLPLSFVDALNKIVDIDFGKEPTGLGNNGKNFYSKDIWLSTKEIVEIVQSSVLPYMFKSDYEAIKEGNNIWTKLLVPAAKLYSWDPSSDYIHDSPYLTDGKEGKSSGYVEYEITPQVDHYFELVGVLERCWQLVEAKEYVTRLLFEPTTTTWEALMNGSCVHEVIDIVGQVEIRTLIFDDSSRFPFDPGDCWRLCSCLLSSFLEVKEVLKEGVLIRFRNRAAMGGCTNAWRVVH